MNIVKITSIQVGRTHQYEAKGDQQKLWTSAIVKRPVSGSVFVGQGGLAGDEQADRKHHGGPDKAVLGYSAEHYPLWNAEFPDNEFGPGGFGENLTISGIDESACCIGDVIQVGDCKLQISQPRQPCWKLSRRWSIAELSRLVQQNGRTGWYYRVLEEGTIKAEMEVELVERPHPAFTITWASDVMHAKPKVVDDDLKLAECPSLSESWRTTLANRARR